MIYSQKTNRKAGFNIIVASIIPQICSILFIMLFPARAAEENLLFLFTLNAYFYFIMLFIAIPFKKILSTFSKSKNRHTHKSKLTSARHTPKCIILLYILPITGLALLIIDRVYIRGIDYSKELRAARYEWLASDGGTLWGIVGTIAVHIAYPCIFFSIRNSSLLKKRHLFSLTTASIVSILGISILNGGRSPVLFFLLTIIIAILTKPSEQPILSLKNKITIIASISLCASIFYSFRIIESSVIIGDSSLPEILELSIYQMYGTPDKDFFLHPHNNSTYLLNYSLLYMFHSQWVTQSLPSLLETPGYYSIVSMPTMYLDRLGILDINSESIPAIKAGLFLSLPGGIYYDFRWPGIIIFSIILGLFLGVSLFYLSKTNMLHSFKAAFIVSILYFVFLSPMLSAQGLANYFLIIFAFLITGLLSRLILNEKIYY